MPWLRWVGSVCPLVSYVYNLPTNQCILISCLEETQFCVYDHLRCDELTYDESIKGGDEERRTG